MMTAVFCTLMITACGSGGGGADKATSTGGGSAPALTPPTITPPVTGGTDPILVVYTKSMNESVTTGGQTYALTLTGYCTVYNAHTYCWDDGWHRAGASIGQSYWGLIAVGQGLSQGAEGAATIADPFAAPRLMSVAIPAVIASATYNSTSLDTAMNDVVTNGTQSQIHCNDDGSGTLDCGTFSLVVSQ